MFDVEVYLTRKGIDPYVAKMANIIFGHRLTLKALNDSYDAETGEFISKDFLISNKGFLLRGVPNPDAPNVADEGRFIYYPSSFITAIMGEDGDLVVGIYEGKTIPSDRISPEPATKHTVHFITIPKNETTPAKYECYNTESFIQYLDAYHPWIIDPEAPKMNRGEIYDMLTKLMAGNKEFPENGILPDKEGVFCPATLKDQLFFTNEHRIGILRQIMRDPSIINKDNGYIEINDKSKKM